MVGKDLSVWCWYMEVMYLNCVLKTKFEVCDHIHVCIKQKKAKNKRSNTGEQEEQEALLLYFCNFLFKVIHFHHPKKMQRT